MKKRYTAIFVIFIIIMSIGTYYYVYLYKLVFPKAESKLNEAVKIFTKNIPSMENFSELGEFKNCENRKAKVHFLLGNINITANTYGACTFSNGEAEVELEMYFRSNEWFLTNVKVKGKAIESSVLKMQNEFNKAKQVGTH